MLLQHQNNSSSNREQPKLTHRPNSHCAAGLIVVVRPAPISVAIASPIPSPAAPLLQVRVILPVLQRPTPLDYVRPHADNRRLGLRHLGRQARQVGIPPDKHHDVHRADAPVVIGEIPRLVAARDAGRQRGVVEEPVLLLCAVEFLDGECYGKMSDQISLSVGEGEREPYASCTPRRTGDCLRAGSSTGD